MGDAKPIDNVTGGEVPDPNLDPTDTKPEEEVSEEPAEETDEEASKPEVEAEAPQEDKAEPEAKEDSPFTSSVDPSKLPKELQGVYKQMQADYTRKTQEVAGLRRSAEAYQRFQPYLQKIFADENLTNLVFKGQPKEAPQEEEYPDDPKEFAQRLKAEALAEIRKETEERERQRTYAEADAREREEAEKVDPRLSSEPPFAKTIAGMVNSNPDYQNRRITASEATRQAIKEFDEYVHALALKRNEELVKKARNSSSGVANRTSPSSTVTPDRPLSIKEAWAEAEKELAQSNSN